MTLFEVTALNPRYKTLLNSPHRAPRLHFTRHVNATLLKTSDRAHQKLFHAQQQSACCRGSLLSPFPPESSVILIALQNQFRQPRFHHTSFPNPTCRCPGRAVAIPPTPRLLPAPKRAPREPSHPLACLLTTSQATPGRAGPPNPAQHLAEGPQG